ncbi:hypothetical protein RXV86_04845 [Alisedimentitalea sp. MJ-SS2]|uniref:hypothetical protein n=1 Tax=Aliisedimentitalea sp. MJ-SS2 TaxID=3049795 RepID=UPI00290B0DBB|nr:hypothetical protein [Alisedimentitalea sp. MJ-SS2]MDU8926708.1 hypothetical protein [Alisedimentitalea sp. MJ-SS2]
MATGPVMSEPDRFSVLLGSHHINGTGFNEINPGLFATWERERWAYSIGGYLNSYEKGSLAATAHLPLFHWDRGAISAFGGLAWYPGDGRRFSTRLGGDVVGIGGVELRQGNVFMQFVPMSTNSVDGLVTFGLTWAAEQ